MASLQSTDEILLRTSYVICNVWQAPLQPIKLARPDILHCRQAQVATEVDVTVNTLTRSNTHTSTRTSKNRNIHTGQEVSNSFCMKQEISMVLTSPLERFVSCFSIVLGDPSLRMSHSFPKCWILPTFLLKYLNKLRLSSCFWQIFSPIKQLLYPEDKVNLNDCLIKTAAELYSHVIQHVSDHHVISYYSRAKAPLRKFTCQT
jgi:hypothetical protein